LDLEDGTSYHIEGCPQYSFHTSLALTRAVFGGNRELSVETEVRMANGGVKLLRDIKIGDSILAWDSIKAVPTRVTDIPYDDNSDTWRVTTKTGLMVEGDERHCFPALVYRKRGIQKHTLGEIRDGKYPQKRFVKPAYCEFLPTVVPFSGLLLGLYLGDGSYGDSPSNDCPRPNFTNEKKYIRDLFEKEINKYFPTLHCSVYPSDISRLYVCGKQIRSKNKFCSVLDELGLAGRKSYEKFVPDEYKYGSLKTRRGVLEGIILTDGCTDRYKIAIYSTSLRQLKDLEEIILSLGGRGRTYKDHESENKNQHKGWKLQFSIGYVSIMGLDLRHKMPKDILERKCRQDDVIVDNVTYVGVKRCRCLTVSHVSHTFLLANGIVTCNSGKTCCGAVETGFHMTGLYPDWYPKERRYTRPVKGRIFATDFTKGVGEVITPAIEEWWPEKNIKHSTKNNGGVTTKYWVNHVSGGVSTVDILSYEQNSKLCEGWNGDFVWYDEPPPRSHRIATLRGLTDRMGWEIFTLTPLDQPWLFDEIWESSNKNIATFLMDIRHNLMRQNPKTSKFIGLSEHAISRFEDALTEEEKQVRRHGRFTHLAGRIFKTWDRRVHTFNRDMWKKDNDEGCIFDGQPPKRWPRMMLIDPHDRKPAAVLWVAMDPIYEVYYIYREAWLDMIFKDQCRHIMNEEVGTREKIMVRVMDPNFGPKHQNNTGKTVRDTFEAEAEELGYPMRFSFGDDHKALGRKEVNKMMWYDKEMPLSIINQPKIMIANDLVKTIYMIEHYIWDDFKQSSMEKDIKETVKDLNTDFPDLLHYLALSKWRGQECGIIPGIGNAYAGGGR